MGAEKVITINDKDRACGWTDDKRLSQQEINVEPSAEIARRAYSICQHYFLIFPFYLLKRASGRCRRPIKIGISIKNLIFRTFQKLVKIGFWAGFGSIFDPDLNSV